MTQDKPAFTPGPWTALRVRSYLDEQMHWGVPGVAHCGDGENSEANARLIAAAPDLFEAAQLLEAAEHNRQFCDECEGDGEPEACGKCFPKFDDARVKRRIAIAKALGAKAGGQS